MTKIMRTFGLGACLGTLIVCGGCEGLSPEQPRVDYRIEAISDLQNTLPTQVLKFKIHGAEAYGLPEVSVNVQGYAPIEVVVEKGFGENEWFVRPSVSWPSGVEITIAFHRHEIVLAQFRFMSSDRKWVGPPQVSFIAPLPGMSFAPNTQFLIADVLPVERELTGLRLFSSLHELDFEVLETLRPGRYAAKLSSRVGFCEGLCPDTRYDVWAEFSNEVISTELILTTSSIADNTAPAVEIENVQVWSEQLKIRLNSNEPILAVGRLRSEFGDVIELQTVQYFLGGLILGNAAQLEPDTSYLGDIELWDLSGNKVSYETGWFNTPQNLDVEITELVPTPIRDWNDSEKNGEPFDPFPGKGTVSHADEWIELVNRSSLPVDIRKSDLYIRVIDSRPTETSIRSAPATFLLDKQEDAIWLPNTALVVRPRGDMNQTDVTVQVLQGTRLLDEVVIGKDIDSVHLGGRTPRAEFESIAKDEFGDWRWCIPSPGGATRRGDCL